MANMSMLNVNVTILMMVMALCFDHINAIDYCQLNLFDKSINSTVMQLTKEAVTKEYAILNEFKSLHCCAKGYRSIEWFKNGRPQPWPTDVSSFILYPEAENQTIYTLSSSLADNGNYTCVLRNDTHKMEHHMVFNVQANLPANPLATYRPHDQFIPLGETARLYCEAFVGKVKLPDARNFISWYQIFDDQENPVDGLQEIITREDGQIVGALLTFKETKSHHYGRYLCRIEIGNAAHRLDMTSWLFGTPIVAVEESSLFTAIMLALGAVVLVFIILFLIRLVTRAIISQQNRQRKLKEMYCTEGFRVRSV